MNAVEIPILEENSPEVSETSNQQSLMGKIGSLFRKEPKPEIKSAEPLPYKIPNPDDRKNMGGEDIYNE